MHLHVHMHHTGVPGRYLAYKRVPESLRNSIFNYYQFMWGSLQTMDEDHVLVDLPPLMQLQIDIVSTKLVFSRITLFRVCVARLFTDHLVSGVCSLSIHGLPCFGCV